MGKVIDIIGKKFGKLTVLDINSERGNRGQIRYECKCDCGNSHITSGESIRSWKSKSCVRRGVIYSWNASSLH